MRALLFFIIATLIFSSLRSQPPTLQWAKSFSGSDYEACQSNVTDAVGNIYSISTIFGTTDMDPSPGIYNLTSNGSYDIVISKLNAQGDFIWAKRVGGLFNDGASTLDIDNNGNLYIGGSFQSTVDFDPGPGFSTLNNVNGGIGTFLLKLDFDGNFIFAKKIAGSEYSHSLRSLALSLSGNIYVTGTFTGTSDFDPGPGVFNLSTSITDSDIFISKYDNNGNLIWAKQFAGNNGGVSWSLDIDGLENIYAAGIFYGTCDFDPSPSVFNLTSVVAGSGFNSDIFITKLNSSGNFVFAKQVTGLQGGDCWGMSVDPTGNIFMTGNFLSITDFDPGPNTFLLNPGNYPDAFVLKLDNLGNFIWVKSFESVGQPTSNSRGISICSDNQGNIYTTGDFGGGVDFNPGSGVFVMNSSNPQNIFVSKLNSNGDFLFALSFEGPASNPYIISNSIIIDPLMNIVIGGLFSGTFDFDPLSGVFNMASIGGADAFILKLHPPCILNSASALNVFNCNSYTLNNQTYNSTGTYSQTLLNAAGCDSVITLNLIIGGSLITTSATACNSYLWEGINYNSSGLYTAAFIGANGCDSIRKLNLTIKNSTSSVRTISICEGQTYEGHSVSGTYISTLTGANGCDSIRTLNLTVKQKAISTINAVICEGSSFNGYTNAGTYLDTYFGSNGCDSTRTLHLVVNPKKFKNLNVSFCEGNGVFAGGMWQTNSGIYKDTLLTSLGCDSIITTNLQINPKPIPNLGQDKNICSGTPLKLSPGIFSTYQWQNFSSGPSFTVLDTGLYWVMVTNSFNCSARDSIRINEIKPTPKDFLKKVDSICSYETIVVQSLKNFNNYLWSNGETLNKIKVVKLGNYSLKVIDGNGCIGADTISIFAKNCQTGIFFPNAFTPNRDGKNDIYKPIVFGHLRLFKFQIYDRAGQVVFQTEDPTKGWKMESGFLYSTTAFVWQCMYQFEGQGKKYENGTVLLIR